MARKTETKDATRQTTGKKKKTLLGAIGHIVQDIWLDFERLAKGVQDEERAKKEN